MKSRLVPENIEIEVMFNKERAADLQNLSSFPIILSDGSQIPLASVAILEHQRNYVRIQRINGLRTLSVYGDLQESVISSGEVLSQFRTKLMPQLQQDYPGLRFDFEGAAKDTAETGQSMATGFMLGIFGVFVILSFQFRSYLEPFVVLLAIPLALIGVFWGPPPARPPAEYAEYDGLCVAGRGSGQRFHLAGAVHPPSSR